LITSKETSYGGLHGDLLQNFYHSVIQIKRTFEITLNKETDRKGTLKFIYEEGVLFHFTPNETSVSKKITELTYWVVGRMILDPEPQQIFICFQDGVQHNAVEIAFKIGFGIGI